MVVQTKHNREKVRRMLRRNYRFLLKSSCIPLALVVFYQALSATIPFVGQQVSNLTVLSSGISYLIGEGQLENQMISQFHAEDQNSFTSTSEQEQDDLADPSLPDTSTAENSSPEEIVQNGSSLPETNSELPAAPERPENAGTVVDRLVGPGDTPQFVKLTNSFVKNLSALSAEQIRNYSQQSLSFSLEETSEPQVLIYHTHTTESYQPYDCDWYDPAYNARNTDNSQNMAAVGDVLTQQLQSYGIGVIHDTTQHDNPSYTGAYDRSRATIQKYLEQYPSIKVILDIHRDALQGENLITAPTTEINGVKTAQMMIIACCDDGSGSFPNDTKNLAFACQLQEQIESDYPTLTRPMLFDDRHYNQDMAPGALLVEIGGHGNTLPEAKNAARLLGDSLAKILKP